MEPTPSAASPIPASCGPSPHPVRLAILEHLTVEGPMTATALGARIGESPANCSWHLRKLAEHGFVEEAPGGTGRQRPWRAVSRGMRWNDVDDSPELQRAGDALSQVLVEREVARLAESRARGHEEDPAWREAATAEPVDALAHRGRAGRDQRGHP